MHNFFGFIGKGKLPNIKSLKYDFETITEHDYEIKLYENVDDSYILWLIKIIFRQKPNLYFDVEKIAEVKGFEANMEALNKVKPYFQRAINRQKYLVEQDLNKDFYIRLITADIIKPPVFLRIDQDKWLMTFYISGAWSDEHE